MLLNNEGKTPKYLKYALGEIILVVIGILIALRVNNWNEYRHTRNEEKELLHQLQIEFQSIQKHINGYIDEQKSVKLSLQNY